MTVDPRATEARRRLAGPDHAPLWGAVRRRLERNGVEVNARPVSVEVPPGPAREAIAGLLGTSPAGTRPIQVRLDHLDTTLRRNATGCGLIELLTELGGPVEDRRATRAAAADAVESLWQDLAAHPAVERRPALEAWLVELRRSGTATRLGRTPTDIRRLVQRALDVVDALPVRDLPLARFAAQVTSDSHALDRQQSLGTIVLSAIPHISPSIPPTGRPTGPALASSGAAAWRQAWARVGVLCDDLSVSVLVLNLPLIDEDDLVGDTIRRHRRAGEPLRITLRQLGRARLRFASGATVRTCENPTVLAQAALELGADSAPLVCTDGQPDSAVDELLGQLVRDGASISHHGDFDWGGIRIANHLADRHGADPWRFRTADYHAAIETLRGDELPAPPPGLATRWDDGLVEAMSEAQVRIYEEQVLDDLIQDLRER